MPKYLPNSRFSDCYASVGNVTFFHKNGECYYRTKAKPVFPGTAGQQIQLSIHQRGLREWRNLGHDEQLEWNALARGVRSKRPPFNTRSNISGYNLFMSAYHGLACIGDEKVPEPQPLPNFPVVYLELTSAAVLNETDLQISFRINGVTISDRLRIIGKIQLTAPGYSAHRGKFRNYVGILTDECNVSFVIHDYRSVYGLDLKGYQVHLRYLLIDAESGHRSRENSLTAGIEI
ncbi:MAG: hypothetical protein IJZ70_10700 [Bacteroidales bacterium]|nr:hypothetical protein [Bacteroidales bacterium]